MSARIDFKSGNWNIRCLNEEHRRYLEVAKRRSDLAATIQSWFNAWLHPTMEKEYLYALAQLTTDCDLLWKAIPNKVTATMDLSKNH